MEENKYYYIHVHDETKILTIIKILIITTALAEVRGLCWSYCRAEIQGVCLPIQFLFSTLPIFFSALYLIVCHISPVMHLHFDRPFWKWCVNQEKKLSKWECWARQDFFWPGRPVKVHRITHGPHKGPTQSEALGIVCQKEWIKALPSQEMPG